MDKLLIEYPDSYDHCSMLGEEAHRQFLFCLKHIPDLACYYFCKLDVYRKMNKGLETEKVTKEKQV